MCCTRPPINQISGRTALPVTKKNSKILAAIIFACLCSWLTAHAQPWERVLSFDVLSKEKIHKANLGSHRVVLASWVADLGWDIGVFDYPVKPNSENLLYQGHNWHGIQPWMVFPWTKHRNTYPDERVVTYNEGKSQLRIVLVDCETRHAGGNLYQFVKGRIEIYHRQGDQAQDGGPTDRR